MDVEWFFDVFGDLVQLVCGCGLGLALVVFIWVGIMLVVEKIGRWISG